MTDKSDGIYRLESENSPAHRLLAGMPFSKFTEVDIDGEERGPNTDAGCNQLSKAAPFSAKPKKVITEEDTGPEGKTESSRLAYTRAQHRIR